MGSHKEGVDISNIRMCIYVQIYVYMCVYILNMYT